MIYGDIIWLLSRWRGINGRLTRGTKSTIEVVEWDVQPRVRWIGKGKIGKVSSHNCQVLGETISGCHRSARRALITSSISLFHSPVQVCGSSGLLGIENVASSRASEGGNIQAGEEEIVEGSIYESDVDAECEWLESHSLRRRGPWEYEWERDREGEETERKSCSTSTPNGFGVVGLGG